MILIAVLLILNFRRVSITKYSFGILSLVYLIPTYKVIMLIYSICNISDVTWGSRSITTKDTRVTVLQRRIDEKYKAYRTQVLIYWLILNLIVAESIIGYADAQEDQGSSFLIHFSLFLASLMWIKLLFALAY